MAKSGKNSKKAKKMGLITVRTGRTPSPSPEPYASNSPMRENLHEGSSFRRVHQTGNSPKDSGAHEDSSPQSMHSTPPTVPSTEEVARAVALKDQIEELVQKGYLKKYVAKRREEKKAERDSRQDLDYHRKRDKPPEGGNHDILTISGDEGRSEKILGSQREARECNFLKPSKSRRNDKDDEEEKEKEKERGTKRPKGLSASAQGSPSKRTSMGTGKSSYSAGPKDSEEDQPKLVKFADIDSRPESEESGFKSMELDEQTESISLTEEDTEK
ncbi:mediator of RNA polymerase II transcription subunit 1.1-like [Chenopodium quinoa]|uniref:mediator of RNA polymerase II transcription subunit 1.1-like n=1 Tax=Chenopodium quinoa TaxID=63459 RepID=UPI000B77E36D|nr:mediator of RNA polymerase II transcription subunit 1.1-like [Chenopodium quinoa]